MDNKYYTPDIEEFHVGFECEIEVMTPAGNTTEYKKYIISENDNIKELYEPNDWYNIPRVKCLDQEDIEALGFSLDQKVKGEYFFIYGNMISGDYMLTTKDFKIVNIFNMVGNSNEVYYIGPIKNKSELKKLIKQLNIK